MGTCTVHFFGSNTIMDALTEHRLGSDLAARMEAISLVFQGMSHWQRSYISDIEGRRNEAVVHYEDAQTAFVEALSRFKSAEFERAQLVAHFLSVHSDYAIRPAVKAAFLDQEVSDVVSQMISDGRLPRFVATGDLGNFGIEFAHVSFPSPETPATGDSMIDTVISFFATDLQKLREIKTKCNDIINALASEKPQVERGTLYESLGHSIHAERRLYGLSTLTAQIRIQLVEYITFVELYGGIITNSLLHTSDDDVKKWHEVTPLIRTP